MSTQEERHNADLQGVLEMDQDGNGWLRKRIESGASESNQAHERSTATFIDSGANFEGSLRLTESFRIDGEFRGNIESRCTVIVGEGAGVEADVHARDVIIAGAVVGNVTATRQLTLRGTARIHGNIETPSIEAERGAVLNGMTKMVRPDAAARGTAQTSTRAEPQSAVPVQPSAAS
jgi:cytoskeletal protein CcmA (bactofilin family)